MVLLIGAETYSFLILYLGFVQTIAPLRRPPVPLPEDHALWPTVDVMVPTYNEPLEVVRYTVLAAQEIDWPQDKINVWLLDDGEREGFARSPKLPESTTSRDRSTITPKPATSTTRWPVPRRLNRDLRFGPYSHPVVSSGHGWLVFARP